MLLKYQYHNKPRYMPDLSLYIMFNFFSSRVVEASNLVPGVIKKIKNSEQFQNAYSRHREDMAMETEISQ